jgi:glycosyltransferase involved in cell wall biosynthesis
VVDNGSIDETKDVIDSVQLSNIKLRQITEPRAGQSHARNTGLEHTSGDIILFTDDDIRVPSNWVEGMIRPILNGTADAVAGGVIFPSNIALLLSHPPLSSRRDWFASTESLDRQLPDRMVGANMSFHRRILKTIPKFDVELGPGVLGFADETLFSAQLISAGYRLISALEIAVEHHFDVRRLTTESILDLARKMGRSNAYIFHHWENQKLRKVELRLTLCRLHLLRIKFSHLRRRNVYHPSLEDSLRLEQSLAFYREYLIQRRRPRKYTIEARAVK